MKTMMIVIMVAINILTMVMLLTICHETTLRTKQRIGYGPINKYTYTGTIYIYNYIYIHIHMWYWCHKDAIRPSLLRWTWLRREAQIWSSCFCAGPQGNSPSDFSKKIPWIHVPTYRQKWMPCWSRKSKELTNADHLWAVKYIEVLTLKITLHLDQAIRNSTTQTGDSFQ